MPHYKLTYFNLRARGELIRFVLEVAGVLYEDVRIEYSDWASLKPKTPTPFGQLPMFSIDGVDYCQSYAIARHLARTHGLAGKTDIDQLRADMLVDCMEDIIRIIIQFSFYTTVESVKAEQKKRFADEQLPGMLNSLQSLLSGNKSGDGYFVGDGLTWADLQLVILGDWLQYAGVLDKLTAYPKLLALKERASKHPNIAAWLAKRPNNDH